MSVRLHAVLQIEGKTITFSSIKPELVYGAVDHYTLPANSSTLSTLPKSAQADIQAGRAEVITSLVGEHSVLPGRALTLEQWREVFTRFMHSYMGSTYKTLKQAVMGYCSFVKEDIPALAMLATRSDREASSFELGAVCNAPDGRYVNRLRFLDRDLNSMLVEYAASDSCPPQDQADIVTWLTKTSNYVFIEKKDKGKWRVPTHVASYAFLDMLRGK